MRPRRNMFVLSRSVVVTPWTAAYPWILCPWDSPGKNTGVGCHFIIQGIFLTQGSNLCLLSPALAGRFFTTALPGKPQVCIKQLTNRIHGENRGESQGKLGVKSSSGGGWGRKFKGRGSLELTGLSIFSGLPLFISFIQFFFLVLNPQNGLTVFLTVLVRPVFNRASHCVNLCLLICSSFFSFIF